jgi:copper chaperone CopZ
MITLVGTNQTVLAQTDSVLTVVIKVKNLHCNNDMPTIKKRLLNAEGIDEVQFTDRKNEVSVFTVTYHSAATSKEQIEQVIEATPGCDNKNEMPYRVKKEKPAKKDKS